MLQRAIRRLIGERNPHQSILDLMNNIKIVVTDIPRYHVYIDIVIGVLAGDKKGFTPKTNE